MPHRSKPPFHAHGEGDARLGPLLIGLLLVLGAVYARPAWTAMPIDSGRLVAEAQRFEHGEGVTRDLDRAFRMYCVAALTGDAKAAYQLGWMYANGRGVAVDDARAVGWFRTAVSGGDRFARRLLRRMRSVTPRPDPACPMQAEGQAVGRDTVAVWVGLLAPYYDLAPELVLAVIDAESGFDPRARSPKGAQGLMQLIPATAKRFDVEDPWRPLDNLHGGMAYLRWLLERFDGDVELALAGYNAGENAVARYAGIPPYRETRNYVKRITRVYRAARLEVAEGDSALLPVGAQDLSH